MDGEDARFELHHSAQTETFVSAPLSDGCGSPQLLIFLASLCNTNQKSQIWSAALSFVKSRPEM